jgi:hypothetical protein
VLSDGSTQGEDIGFAQFERRKLYQQISEGFSISGDLVTRKQPLVQLCPL